MAADNREAGNKEEDRAQAPHNHTDRQKQRSPSKFSFPCWDNLQKWYSPGSLHKPGPIFSICLSGKKVKPFWKKPPRRIAKGPRNSRGLSGDGTPGTDKSKPSSSDKGPLLPSHSFLTNRQRMAFSTARIITPTSAKMARYILAMPTAPKIRQANLTPRAMVMF